MRNDQKLKFEIAGDDFREGLTAIISVKKGIDLEISTDLFSIDIRECLRHLGNITGEYDVDKDILGHIFSNFCILFYDQIVFSN